VGWSRDTEGFCFRLRFDPEHCKWLFIGNDGQLSEEKAEEKDDGLLPLVDEFLQEEWSGTATELCDALKAIDPEADIAPRTVTKRLKSNIGLFEKNNIAVTVDRNRDSRAITLTRRGEREQPDTSA
jgi:hypothetical protein